MKRYALLIIFLTFNLFLYSEEIAKDIDTPLEITPLIDITGMPDSMVGGCVNVITGTYNEGSRDLYLYGSNPLQLNRSYNSNNGEEGTLMHGWDINLPGKVAVECARQPDKFGYYHRAAWLEHGATHLKFYGNDKHKTFELEPRQIELGVTNCASGFPNAKDNIKNMTFLKSHSKFTAQLEISKNERLLFEILNLKLSPIEELFITDHVLPNGCTYKYLYDVNQRINDYKLCKIISKGASGDNLGNFQFNIPDDITKKPVITVENSTGEMVTYKFKRMDGKDGKKNHRYCLIECNSSMSPKQSFEYLYLSKKTNEKLSKSILPEGRFRQIEYYKKGYYSLLDKKFEIEKSKDFRFGRVSALFAPIGTDETPLPAFQFVYAGKSCTEVYDALHNKTSYHYTPDLRLRKIENYKKDGSLYRSDNIFWGDKETKNVTLLKKRALKDALGKSLLTKDYRYDYRGNVIEEKTTGDLKGTHSNDTHIIRYRYTQEDQVSFKDDGIKQVYTTYVPKTDLIKSIIIKKGSKILERTFYEYDSNGAMKLEVIDDGYNESVDNLSGVTERRIKRVKSTNIGLPGVVEEKYLNLAMGKEVLLKRIHIVYSNSGLPIKQKAFDANGELAYILESEYDSMGNLLMEKDPVGNVTSYRYDSNKNCVYKKISNSTYHTSYSYDYSNRLIRESQVDENGIELTRSYSYDLCGNKISSTDIFGNTTRYIYDEFNRLIKTISPNKNVEFIVYDEFNNVTSKTDANGHTTKISYTALKKPSKVIHPDGAIENHLYNIHGLLKKSTLPNGSYICFKYDYKDRLILKQSYGSDGKLIAEHKWIYNAFHLVREIDSSDKITDYIYDNSGKLIQAQQGDSETQFLYDSLGRKQETLEKCNEGYFKKTIQVFDVLNRVIEERIEDSFGAIFSIKNFQYDAFGNTVERSILTSQGKVSETIEYDCFNQPVTIMHPNGEASRYYRDYNHKNERGNFVGYVEEIDSIGNVIARTNDEDGRLILEEHRSSHGAVMRHVEYRYDRAGNLISRFDDVETGFAYDSRNREISITEAVGRPEQKITKREYNKIGKVSKIIKPDGTTIKKLYDDLGRLTDEIDSKKAFHYRYSYHVGDLISSVTNLITGSTIEREYDPQGRIVKEIQDNGIEIKFDYDDIDRVTKLTLHDGTDISYEYDAKNLRKLVRDTGREVYAFEYAYDLSGKIESLGLPLARGDIVYRYDNALRLSQIDSPYYSQTIPEDGYDPCDYLVKYLSEDSLGSTIHNYAYDSMHQLIGENGLSYAYDCRSNRTQKGDISYENNALNHLLAQGPKTYDYDSNGNTKIIQNETSIHECRYDTLDRLIEVVNGETKVSFEYDAFHRRMSKQTFELIEGQWEEKHYEKYLYLFDLEIGSTDFEGKINQLKVMGPGSLNSGAAFELNNRIFIPIHNHRGDVVTLVDLNEGTIEETNRYSAFGEEDSKKHISPWRFSGKRFDEETGWVFFGRRYYDPEIGRWTTPDPIWFEDGPNLYAYVSNSPIVFVDPNGLTGEKCRHQQWKDMEYRTNTFEITMEYLFNSINFIGSVLCGRMNEFKWTDMRSFVATYPGDGTEIKNLKVSISPGIYTCARTSCKYAKNLSELYGGIPVKFYHNQSHHLFDVLECLANLIGLDTEPVRQLRAGISEDLASMDPEGMVFHHGHSQGCIVSRNAFRGLDAEDSQRVVYVGIAPGAYTSRDECLDVIHLVSDGDFVHRFDFIGKMMNEDTIINLKRMPGTKWPDHAFKSPTFSHELNKIINRNMELYGFKK